jgi:hypothetical protein
MAPAPVFCRRQRERASLARVCSVIRGRGARRLRSAGPGLILYLLRKTGCFQLAGLTSASLCRPSRRRSRPRSPSGRTRSSRSRSCMATRSWAPVPSSRYIRLAPLLSLFSFFFGELHSQWLHRRFGRSTCQHVLNAGLICTRATGRASLTRCSGLSAGCLACWPSPSLSPLVPRPSSGPLPAPLSPLPPPLSPGLRWNAVGQVDGVRDLAA